MAKQVPFELTSDEPCRSSGTTLVVDVPPSISSPETLMRVIAESLEFPSYFGWNWDAVDECIRDLRWLESQMVVLVHSDLPSLVDDELQIYLEVLADAVETWRAAESCRLCVVFPMAARGRIDVLLAEWKEREAFE